MLQTEALTSAYTNFSVAFCYVFDNSSSLFTTVEQQLLYMRYRHAVDVIVAPVHEHMKQEAHILALTYAIVLKRLTHLHM
jgi:hypothetical protein